MATVDSATPVRTHRLAALSALLGILLPLGSTFFPGIIRILYQSRSGCPDGPECPPPDIDASSFWEGLRSSLSSVVPLTFDRIIASLLWLAPFITFFIIQAMIAWRAWSGQL